MPHCRLMQMAGKDGCGVTAPRAVLARYGVID
jgi:hypothetical protein